jgi:preprotein translocase subunit YajC
MFISPAYAQGFGSFGGADASQMLQTILPFALIMVVFYFLLIRPQQQKAKDHKNLLSALRRGDRVVTGGGIVGTVAKVVNDDEVLVDIAENTRVRVLRSTITTVLAKTEPVAAKTDAAPKAERAEEAAEAESDRGKGSARRAAGGK